jgi:hypothetical protein
MKQDAASYVYILWNSWFSHSMARHCLIDAEKEWGLIYFQVVVHVEGETLCLWTAVTNGPIIHSPYDILVCVWNATVELYWQGKPKNSEESCSCYTSPKTNPTWTDAGTNPSLRGERPVTNHLRQDTLTSNFLRVEWNGRMIMVQ